MREIKFRTYEDGVMLSSTFTESVMALRGWKQHENYILMQYTGLKDKNGKEVYEGDILKNPNDSFGRNSLVSWSGAGFWSEPIHPPLRQFGRHLVQDDVSTWEVIGNIYENPGLLHSEVV